MEERRPTKSELRLRRLLAEDADSSRRGILELFDDAAEEPSDEDAPLARDADDPAE